MAVDGSTVYETEVLPAESESFNQIKIGVVLMKENLTFRLCRAYDSSGWLPVMLITKAAVSAPNDALGLTARLHQSPMWVNGGAKVSLQRCASVKSDANRPLWTNFLSETFWSELLEQSGLSPQACGSCQPRKHENLMHLIVFHIVSYRAYRFIWKDMKYNEIIYNLIAYIIRNLRFATQYDTMIYHVESNIRAHMSIL